MVKNEIITNQWFMFFHVSVWIIKSNNTYKSIDQKIKYFSIGYLQEPDAKCIKYMTSRCRETSKITQRSRSNSLIRQLITFLILPEVKITRCGNADDRPKSCCYYHDLFLSNTTTQVLPLCELQSIVFMEIYLPTVNKKGPRSIDLRFFKNIIQ